MKMSKNYKQRRIMADTDIAPEATDLLFEVEDVAQVIAEVTGEDVEVTADENEVTFAVGDETYTVEAEGDEEIVEMSVRPKKSNRKVSASRTRKPAGKTVKRFANKK